MSYSKNELLQCICECMAESLPDNWEAAHMRATITNNEIDAIFRYRSTSSEQEQTFRPENTIAPMNAAKELQKLMNSEGNMWSAITVNITSDGNYEVFTD